MKILVNEGIIGEIVEVSEQDEQIMQATQFI